MTKGYILDFTAGALLEIETKLWLELKVRSGVVYLDELCEHLPARSASTVKRYDAVIRNRLGCLKDVDIKSLNKSYGESFRQKLLLLIMSRTQAVTDFIKDVYCEAKFQHQFEISIGQVERFLDSKMELISPRFSKTTVQKVKTNLIKILVEVQMLESSQTMKLQNIYLLPEVYDFATDHGLMHLVNILECRG